jgi:hypothetical protein
MATRSTIAKVERDGSVTSIYCHWDGYPANNGKLLLENYQDEQVVNDLLAGGSLSSLGKVIGEKHPFDWRSDDAEAEKKYGAMCLYYHRDRDESWDRTQPSEHASLAEFLATDREEFTYLWTPEGWLIGTGKNINLTPLTAAACR